MVEKLTELFHPVPPVIPPETAANSEPVPGRRPFDRDVRGNAVPGDTKERTLQ